MQVKIAILAATALVASVGVAAAQDGTQAFRALYPNGAHGARLVTGFRTNDTGYRCKGISYGTGAQSCGTATGGPVGGNNSRN